MSRPETPFVDSLSKMRKQGEWEPMDSEFGVAWFGGKGHQQLSEWLPDEVLEDTDFEDIDFLVFGWRKVDYGE